MKGINKVFIIALFAIIIIIGVVFVRNIRKASEQQKLGVSNPLELKYKKSGESKVSYKDIKVDDEKIEKIAIWYPSELEDADIKYPVILWANGTGSVSSAYKNFLGRLASWGFVVVGNNDKDTRTGKSMNDTLEYLLEEAKNEDSIFFDKIDEEKIGIAGHSQGGVAVFNMITNQKLGKMIKAANAISATSSYHSAILGEEWKYDLTDIKVPMFLTAGTGHFDAGTAMNKTVVNDDSKGIAQGIAPLWSLEENFETLQNIDKVMARKKNVDHGDSHIQFESYMTAWFLYYLKDDKEAKNVFWGENPEILSNENYQDVSGKKK